MAKVLSMRGKEINVTQLLMRNQTVKAVSPVGSAWLNARGDYLDSRGKVVKTTEAVQKEWEDYKEQIQGKSVDKKVSLSNNTSPSNKLSPVQPVKRNPFSRQKTNKPTVQEKVPEVKGQLGKVLTEKLKDGDRKPSDTKALQEKKRVLIDPARDEGNSL